MWLDFLFIVIAHVGVYVLLLVLSVGARVCAASVGPCLWCLGNHAPLVCAAAFGAWVCAARVRPCQWCMGNRWRIWEVRVATVGVHAWHVLACMWTYLDFTSNAQLGEACWSIWEAYDLSLTRSTAAGSASYHYCHEYDDY